MSGAEVQKVVPVDVARLMITSGDSLHIGLSTADEAEVRKGRCLCGFKTIRTTSKAGATDDPLLQLPACD